MMWKLSENGTTVLVLSFVMGIFQILYETSIINGTQPVWNVFGFTFNNPLYFLAMWIVPGFCYFLISGFTFWKKIPWTKN